MAYQDFRDLVAWQKAMELADKAYSLTENFPQREIYGLASQIRRCAVSVPSNIAEGHQRNGKKEFTHFLGIAKGSLAELDTQLEISERRKFISNDEHETLIALIIETDKLIFGLLRSLK